MPKILNAVFVFAIMLGGMAAFHFHYCVSFHLSFQDQKIKMSILHSMRTLVFLAICQTCYPFYPHVFLSSGPYKYMSMNSLSSTSYSEQAGASPGDIPTSTTTNTTFFADRETLISFKVPPSASLAPYFSPFITFDPSSLVTTLKICDSSLALLPPELLRDMISSLKLIMYT